MPSVHSKVASAPPIYCASATLKFADALAIARAAAHKTRQYDSEATRERIRAVARDAFSGKDPYDWQVDVCEATLLCLDCIVIAGTGAGKTLPFVMPLLMDSTKRKMVVIISPLIGLEEDQAKRFRAMGLTATAVNKDNYTAKLHEEIEQRKHRVILVGPEMALESPRFSKLLRSPGFTKDMAAVVVDEAHCISQWGDGFRPKYAELSRLRALVPHGVPFLAASATMPPGVLFDVKQRLAFSLDSTFFVNLGNDRTNITPLVVGMVSASDLTALDFVVQEGLSGDKLIKTVVFFNERELAYQAHRHLQSLVPDHLKDRIGFLHALRGEHSKHEVMKDFREGRLDILCATEAAGMGLDISDIRRVVQFMVPASLSQWLQRYGRAGRDGEPSIAVLLVQPSIFKKVKARVKAENKDIIDILGEQDGDDDEDTQDVDNVRLGDSAQVFQKGIEEGLRDWITTTACRREAANRYFGNPDGVQELTVPCCDVCLCKREADATTQLTPGESAILSFYRRIQTRDGTAKASNTVIKIELGDEQSVPEKGKKPKTRQGDRLKCVREALLKWRDVCWTRNYQRCAWGPESLMSDKMIKKLARSRWIVDEETLREGMPEWPFSSTYGTDVLEHIREAESAWEQANEQAKLERKEVRSVQSEENKVRREEQRRQEQFVTTAAKQVSKGGTRLGAAVLSDPEASRSVPAAAGPAALSRPVVHPAPQLSGYHSGAQQPLHHHAAVAAPPPAPYYCPPPYYAPPQAPAYYYPAPLHPHPPYYPPAQAYAIAPFPVQYNPPPPEAQVQHTTVVGHGPQVPSAFPPVGWYWSYRHNMMLPIER